MAFAETGNHLQGNLLGTIVGAAVANVSTPSFNDDGGYGSIPTLLLRVCPLPQPFARAHGILRCYKFTMM